MVIEKFKEMQKYLQQEILEY